MNSFVLLIVFLICYIPLVVVFAITPYVTRKTESFGVTIPEEEHTNPHVKAIRDNYRMSVLAFGIVFGLFVIVVTLLMPIKISQIFFTAGMFLQIIIMFLFYLSGHKKMKVLKAENNWMVGKNQVVVVDTGFRNKRVMVSPLWFLLYVVLIAATVAFGLIMYDKMPDRIPMHFDINGVANKWAAKSYKVLLFAPVIQLLMTFLFVFVYWIIGKSKQQIDAANPEKSVEQGRRFRYSWSAFLMFTGLATVAIFGFMQIAMTGLVKNPVIITLIPIAISVGIVAAAIILSIKVGQGGSRITVGNIGKSAATAMVGAANRDDDRFWKLGMFYYNPDDPALFVEKRFGIGWTCNFGRPASWIIMIGIIALIPVITWIASSVLTK